MSRATNILFPLILDTLTHKPMLCETQSNLLKDLNLKLKQQGIKVQNLKKELENTVDVGKGLGILTVQDEEVRMPFLLKPTDDMSWSRKMYDDEIPEEAAKAKTPDPNTNENEKPSSNWMPKNTKSPPRRSRCGGRSRRRRRRYRSKKCRRAGRRKRRPRCS